MTAFLPPNLLALFAPRDPIPYLSPLDKPAWLKRPWLYTGLAKYIREFEDPSETPPPTRGETRDEKTKRKRKEKVERNTKFQDEQMEQWDPHNDANAVGTDAFKTLFVGRINYDTSESKLRREMELYGPIKRIHIVHNVNNNKPRGYAFVEYEHERDMHAAYKHADGKKIDGRRIVVDVERGRTVKTWQPRRLGTVTVTEIVTTGIVNNAEIVSVTVTGSVTENVTVIVTVIVTAKRNDGNTEAGHVKKTVTATATVTGTGRGDVTEIVTTGIEIVTATVTERGSVTETAIAIVTANEKATESKKNRMGNTHPTRTRTRWTVTTWKWWTRLT